MKKEVQEIYINLDDSGKLTSKEKISVYGGLVFLSKKEKDKLYEAISFLKMTLLSSLCLMTMHLKALKIVELLF